MPKILISSSWSNEVHEIDGLILGKESKCSYKPNSNENRKLYYAYNYWICIHITCKMINDFLFQHTSSHKIEWYEGNFFEKRWVSFDCLLEYRVSILYAFGCIKDLGVCWMRFDIQLWNYDKCYYIWTKIKPYVSSWENNAERQNLSYCPILHFQIYCCIIIVSCNISFIIWKNKKVLNYFKTPLHVHLMEIIIWDFLFLFSSIHDIELPCERSPSVYKKPFNLSNGKTAFQLYSIA